MKAAYLPTSGEVWTILQVPVVLPAVTESTLLDTFLPFTFVVSVMILAEHGPVVLKLVTALAVVVAIRLVLALYFRAVGALNPVRT